MEKKVYKYLMEYLTEDSGVKFIERQNLDLSEELLNSCEDCDLKEGT